MTHRLLALMMIAACGSGGTSPEDTEPPPGTSPSPSLSPGTIDGTQFGGEGTEPSPTCAAQEGLPLTTAIDDDGTTAADVLAALDAPHVLPVVWFDGRDEDVTVTYDWTGSTLRIDSNCSALVEVMVHLESSADTARLDVLVRLSLRADHASGYAEIEDADWQGTLDHADVLGERCIEGAVWRVMPRAIDGVPSGSLRVSCHAWSEGGGAQPGDDTAGLDTAAGDTGTYGTDTTTTGSATGTLTGTTTGTTTDVDTTDGTDNDDPDDDGDPQLGSSHEVVSW